MSFMRNISIRHKLTAIIMLTSAGILLLAITTFIIWEQIDTRHHMTRDLFIHADMIGENCKAALAFKDSKHAEEILGALHTHSSFVHGCIRTKSGEVFASYHRDKPSAGAEPVDCMVDISKLGQDGYSTAGSLLTVSKPIILDGEVIGSVCLQDDMRRLRSELIWDIVVAIAILACVLAVAYILTAKTQKVISGPILSLTESAEKIGKGQLNHRVNINSKDELGKLGVSFNEMTHKLKESHTHLEEKVQHRTAELSSANKKLETEITHRRQTQRTLEERIKEINCLYDISKLVEQPHISLEQILQQMPELIRNAYRYPNSTCVRIIFDGINYQTDNFDKSELSQYAPIKIHNNKAGAIEAYYIGEKGQNTRKPFLKEEQNMLEVVAERVGSIAEHKKARDKLELFRNLIKQSNDCIYVIEPKWGRILDVNDRACESLGYTRAELLQIAIKDIDESVTDDSSWQQLREELEQKGEIIQQSQHRRRDGTAFYVETSLKLVRRENEEYIIAVARDTTERRKAEEKLKQAAEEWASTFNSIPDLVSIHDKDYKLVRVNKTFADTFGVEPEELIGKYCYEVIHGEKEPCEHCPHKQTIATKKPCTEEFYEPNLGFHAEVSTSPIFDEDGEITGSVHIVKNITDRKRAEEKQTELIEQVESVNRELKDFAYIVSHDLKAPLRGIKSLSKWLSDDYADKLGEKGQEQMNLLLSRVERMHSLIEGVLEYSRVGREQEKQIQVNLKEQIPEVIDMVAPPENITITFENELPTIECEPTRIRQVFQNLLSNAVKYMDKPQGLITIGCVEEGAFWKFSVTDNGPGIDEKHFERIFQMFQTLTSRDTFESTGVGLTVIKKIVEMYGGKIWVESKLGQGSTFFFTMPKQKMGIKDAKFKADITC